MTRTPTLDTHDVQRVRRDSRFRAAIRSDAADPGWRAQGLCLRHDPEVFFPGTLDDPGPALAICDGCPVLGACLATALDVGECDGVWGGTTPRERRTMRQVWPRRTSRAAAGH
jgi:hypothetical protein